MCVSGIAGEGDITVPVLNHTKHLKSSAKQVRNIGSDVDSRIAGDFRAKATSFKIAPCNRSSRPFIRRERVSAGNRLT
mgnify:CR=1 FL=1